jgi:uncharacterized protein YoaH (UPF0181 family)
MISINLTRRQICAIRVGLGLLIDRRHTLNRDQVNELTDSHLLLALDDDEARELRRDIDMAAPGHTPLDEALDQIERLMNGAEWSSETLDSVAEVLRSAGRTIDDIDAAEDDDARICLARILTIPGAETIIKKGKNHE